MKYVIALRKFGECYLDRYRKEFPVIFSMCSFRGKSVLEIGSGEEGYFIKAALKKTKHILATDISEGILKKLRKNVHINTKVCRAEKLPFPDKSFDIVFSRWVVPHVDDLRKTVNEMCRVGGKNVIVVLPSEQGDQTKLKMMVDKNSVERRKERINKIKKIIIGHGFSIKERRVILHFSFPNVDEAMKILLAVEFHNKLSKKNRVLVREFLSKNQNHVGYTQGASFICGYK